MSKKNVEWEWKKLGDLYPISMGKTPPRADKSCWDQKKETNNVWVSIADISANENNVIYDTKEYISNKAAKNITKVEKDSLLLSFKLTIGKMAFAGVPLYTNEAIVNFPPKKGLSLAYLHKYFLYYDWEKSCEGDTKVKGKTLNKEKLKNIDVLLPPLDEQERIVKVLDDAFEKIDAIKTTAETNLQNAKDLFQTTLANELSITDEKIKQGWNVKKIEDTCKRIFAGGDKPSQCYKEKNKDYSIPVYANAIENDGLYGFTDKAIVKEKCISISARGTIGFVCKREHPFVPIVRLIVAIPNEDIIDLDFFFFALRNLDIQGNGTSIPQLTVPFVKQYIISCPPLPVQKQIVAKLDSLSEKVKQLESNYKQVLADCDELKKAILKKAFNGEI